MKANTRGEGDYLGRTDVQGRKGREQMGLETPVVYPLKYGCSSFFTERLSLRVKHPTWELRSQD